MLFHHLQGTNVGVDVEQIIGDFSEDVDARLLEAAWVKVAARHAVLRTRFRWDGIDVPEQQVLDGVDVKLVERDLLALDADVQQDVLLRFGRDDRRRGFDLSVGPLWRITLFRLGPARCRFVFTFHHSILDGAVLDVLEEVFTTYDASRVGATIELIDRRPFRDHISWLFEHIESNRGAADEYFGTLLEGFEEPNRLTALERTDGSGLDEAAGMYGALRFRLGDELSAAMHAFGTDHGLLPPLVIEAAWALVISAFSGSPDVVFGATRKCRRTAPPGSDATIGLLINTPPVRLIIDPAQTVIDLLRSVRQQQKDKRDFEHTPLADVQAVAHSPGAALFESIIVINEQHQDTRMKALGGAFVNRTFEFDDQTDSPLTLLAYTDPSIRCKLSYDRRRFDEAAMLRVQELFIAVLEATVADPNACVRTLPRVPPSELSTLESWNATEREYDHDACLKRLFEAQVDLSPDATALLFRDQTVTYRELDTRAEQFAALLRELGVGPDSMVGLYVERSIDMVVGLLAIVKSGGAYVPLDPVYPPRRIEMMIEDSRISVVLTQSRLATSLPGSPDHVVHLDRPVPERHRDAARARSDGLSAERLAYVIFTSGSTGRPKGVMIEHRNVVNFFVAMDDVLGHSATSAPGVWLAVTSISFDISVLELFWTLTRGFAVVLQEDETRLGGAVAPPRTSIDVEQMEFSLFYFAADAQEQRGQRYRLLLEGAKFADAHGFSAVWTPERHFHEFGGLYPNPAVTSAAVAMVTERISIRAGSVVLPLQNPIRCAEDWSVVDNLSGGRVGLSFASGWHANDFVLAPANFENRRAIMAEGIETIRTLWSGQPVTAMNGEGREISVKIFPPPVQATPPVWITAGGSPETFAMAGRLGTNILTNLLVMNRDDLVRNIEVYRDAFRAAGHEGNGHVSLMLHTFVGFDEQSVRNIVQKPFLEYLRTSTDLINQVQWEQTGFAKPDSRAIGSPAIPAQDLNELDADEMQVIMDHAFERYFRSAGLFGTPEGCLETVAGLRVLGVDEVACLVDFGVDEDLVLESLVHLDRLHQLSNPPQPASQVREMSAVAVGDDSDYSDESDYSLIAQIGGRGVTHLQCTPSLASVIASQPGGLEAIGLLKTLLLGGEALPAALVERVLPSVRGSLLNMYGPTETTIWSTVSPIVDATVPITIGRPIANTTIHIVDRDLQPNPIGVAGELLIGGDGVVRGYLDRPELSTERFVSLAGSRTRVYRTGDLARQLPNGEIEFSGRLDHQVKIRGYRVELGEIESAIGRYPGVFETVVVARSDPPADPRLIAYVVPGTSETDSAAEGWGEVWDQTYRSTEETDPRFDIAGWHDSYSGAPIAADEMHEWVDETVARILALQPNRVLEIGCGTGLLLYRIAPQCERYVALDVSQAALDRIGAQLRTSSLDHIELVKGEARAIGRLVDGSFDTVIVNSVAQYFPDADYLVEVITQALAALAPGGALFLGDLRSRAHAAAFAASIELFKAPADLSGEELAVRVAERVAGDEELLVDPSLFGALRTALPDIDDVWIRVKEGLFDNELTRFRYDVVLRRAGGPEIAPAQERVLRLDEFSAVPIRDSLVDLPDVLRVLSVHNDRLVHEVQLARWLAEPDVVATSAGEFRERLSALPGGVRWEDVAGIDPRYLAELCWSDDGLDRLDLVLRSRRDEFRHDSNISLVAEPPSGQTSWSDHTNVPARRTDHNLGARLRDHLRESLPAHMVPSAFVVLDSLPRTPNGKIDRNALPAPDRSRLETGLPVRPPENDVERAIVGIWQDMLALDAIGVETNVFDLGANSLMMVQASSRLSTLLGRRVSLVDMFKYPTVRALAEYLGHPEEGDTEAMQTSQGRGQARREAMQKRRDTRRGDRSR